MEKQIELKQVNSHEDVVILKELKKDHHDKKQHKENKENKEEDQKEEEKKKEKGSFGLSIFDIAELIKKYDFRNFIEELEEIEKMGATDGIIKMLKTNLTTGLNENDEKDFAERKEIFGSNLIEQDEVPHFCWFVWEALGDFMLRILIITASVQIALGASPLATNPQRDWIEGLAMIVAILVVVTVGSCVNYLKETKFAELNDRNAAMVKSLIRRSGKEFLISPDDILVGDIIQVNGLIPCDGYLVNSIGQILVDESSLTGESDLIEKDTYERCMNKAHEFRGKNPNKHSVPSPFLFSGTTISDGEGWIVAMSVGVYSKKGDIETQVKQNKENEDSKTPLEKKLDTIAGDIAYFGLASGVVTLIALFIRFGITYADEKEYYEELLANPIPGVIPTNPKDTLSGRIIRILMLCLAVIVVAIPEGLPLAVTLSLAFSVGKMMDDQNLVRKMHACETMGGATYICSDKTGTLTENKMNICAIFNGSTEIDTKSANVGNENINDENDNKKEGQKRKRNTVDWRPYFNNNERYYNLLLECIVTNLTMNVDEEDNITKESKTDLAFSNLVLNFGNSLSGLMKKHKVFYKENLKRIPFNSDRKKMSTIVSDSSYPTGHRIYMKGASEIVLKACTHIINPDNLSSRLMTDEENEKIKNIRNNFADLTYRTITVAYKDISEEQAVNYQEKVDHQILVEKTGFTMVALMGIKDTLRQGVTKAIETCHKAGINVMMVTGDLKETAIAISKECGIWTLPLDQKEIPQYYSMTGEDFFNAIEGIECETCNKDESLCKCPKTKLQAEERDLDEDKIQKQKVKNMEKFELIMKDLRVLARSRAHDKFALVLGLKKLNYVVAVTGDGTNDAKALSKANVGFAMGLGGSDVAKMSADILILDDNFASIVKAVRWGRNIYDCIRKFIQFQLTVNVTACLLVFISSCIGSETPITAIQMLWLNLIMDSLGSVALASEPPHDEILNRPPNDHNEYIINPNMFKHIFGHSAVLFCLIIGIYLKGSDFIPESDLERINESRIIANCYKWPGKDQSGVTDGKYNIIAGSMAHWPATVYLKPHVTEAECGVYYRHNNMSAALVEFKNLYGNSAHMTIMFNIFVWYTVCNQINSHVLNDEFNVVGTVFKNLTFIIIIISECILQVLIVQFGSTAFAVSVRGISPQQWGIVIGFSLLAFPVSIILKTYPYENCLVAAYNFFAKLFNAMFPCCKSEDKVDEKAESEHNKLNSQIEVKKEHSLEKGERKSSKKKSVIETIRPGHQSEHRNISKMRSNKELN